jgi:hypothetical protein
MPTFEHVASPLSERWQTRQPSVHSRQAASGGAGKPVAAGVACGAGSGGGATLRSAAGPTAGSSIVAAATRTKARACHGMAIMVPSRHRRVEQP